MPNYRDDTLSHYYCEAEREPRFNRNDDRIKRQRGREKGRGRIALERKKQQVN